MIRKSNNSQGPSLLLKFWLDDKAEFHVDSIAALVARIVSLTHPPGPHPTVAGTLHNMHETEEQIQIVRSPGNVRSSQFMGAEKSHGV